VSNDPAAEPDLRELLLKAASRRTVETRATKAVAGGDKARIVKMIRARWEITPGDYDFDSPTNDELVNLCIATGPIRNGTWMLFMSRSRTDIDVVQLIKKPVTDTGLPAKQIQAIENEFTGPAIDIYRGLRVAADSVGLVLRLGRRGLFVYGHIALTPVGSSSVCFCLGDPYAPEHWRTIFALESLILPMEH
jgi:hypothetical protein